MKEEMKKFLVVALLAGGLIMSTAPAAFAHKSIVTHVETCPEGVTMTVVTFDNDFALPATVTYHWGSNPDSTASLPPGSDSDHSAVSLPSHEVGTLTYHVTWLTDNFRQPPGEGDDTLTIVPMANCPPPPVPPATPPPVPGIDIMKSGPAQAHEGDVMTYKQHR